MQICFGMIEQDAVAAALRGIIATMTLTKMCGQAANK